MKKQTLLTVSALMLIAGSLFAFAGAEQPKTCEQDCAKQCNMECCDDMEECDPSTCDYNSSECAGK